MRRVINGKNFRKIGKGILFILIFCVLFYFAQRLLKVTVVTEFGEDKNLTSQWAEYQSLGAGDLDVIFVGTSHVYCGIDPMYIYENSGITTFDLCLSSSHFETDDLLISEGLKFQKPKTLFLDMSSIHYKKPQRPEKTRMLLDQIPLSSEKISFFFRRDRQRDDLNLLSVLFPLLYYHSRWDELQPVDFRYMFGTPVETCTRGHYVSYKTVPADFQFYDGGGKIGITEEYGWPDLVRIRDLCEDAGVELILFKVPAPKWRENQSEAAEKIAEALGVPFWDLTYEIDEIGLDPSTDYRDEGNHMNQHGAEKLSAYLMEYLQETYHFEDKRGKDSNWDESLPEYEDLIKSKNPDSVS